MWFYFLIFLFLAFFCIINIRQKKFISWVIIVLLALIAGFSGSISKDHDNYIAAYDQVVSGIYITDISFVLITRIIDLLFHNSRFMFLTYAILGVVLKIAGIKRLTELWFYSILVYFSLFYFLHEMTQIRAGVAAAFVLLSIPYIQERNLFKFLICAGIAIFFHFSAFALLPFYFLKNEKVELWYYFLIPIGYILYFANANMALVAKIINVDIITLRYSQIKGMIAQPINIFNVVMISRYLFSAILLWKWKYLKEKNQYAVLLIKFYILSCFLFIALADVPVVAFRVSELIAIVEIIVIPFLIYLFRIQWIGKISVVLIAFFFLSMILLHQKLVLGYF
jgi:hypothetical protein